MLLSFDRTNFPLLAVESAGLEMHLLPVTKVQFEQFLAESSQVTRSQYREMLALNPAVTPEQFTLDKREGLFVTGILPKEAQAFARWLGEGFTLPTVQEWRTIYKVLRRTFLPEHDLSSELVEGPAGQIVDKFSAHLEALTLQEYSLMRGGLVEWVRQGKQWVGLGAPRPQFQPNLWDPLTNEVKPLQPRQRLPYFGFRLIRGGAWYLADRERVRYVH